MNSSHHVFLSTCKAPFFLIFFRGGKNCEYFWNGSEERCFLHCVQLWSQLRRGSKSLSRPISVSPRICFGFSQRNWAPSLQRLSQPQPPRWQFSRSHFFHLVFFHRQGVEHKRRKMQYRQGRRRPHFGEKKRGIDNYISYPSPTLHFVLNPCECVIVRRHVGDNRFLVWSAGVDICEQKHLAHCSVSKARRKAIGVDFNSKLGLPSASRRLGMPRWLDAVSKALLRLSICLWGWRDEKSMRSGRWAWMRALKPRPLLQEPATDTGTSLQHNSQHPIS